MLGDFLYSLPERTEQLFEKVEKGELKVKVQEAELGEIEKTMDRNATKRSLSLLTGMIFVASAIFAQIQNEPEIYGIKLSVIGFVVSLILLIGLIAIFLKDKR